MEEKQALQEQLNECIAKKNALSAEVEQLQSPIKPQLDSIEKTVEGLKKKRNFVPKIVTLIKIVFIIIAFFSLVYNDIVSAIIFGALFGISFPLRKKIENLLSKPFTSKISEENKKKADLENNCPGLKEAKSSLEDIISQESLIQSRLKELKLQEKLGVNNVIICVNDAVSQEFHTKSDIPTTIVIDGIERGFAAKPFSIISLTEGIHTLQLKYNLASQTVTTTSDQFSLKNNNIYFCAKPIFTKKGNFDCSTEKYVYQNSFLSNAWISENDFYNHISRL